MTEVHRFHGRVVRSICVDRPYLSKTKIFSILDSYNDLFAMNQLKGPAAGTRLLTFSEAHELIEHVVNSAFAQLSGLETCLITAKMPSSTPFPERLLCPDVLMCQDVEQESKALSLEGRNFISIRNDVVRHPLEQGDNTLRFAWHAPTHGAIAFGRFVASLAKFGIAPAER